MRNFPRVCPHVEPPQLGYMDWHADAEERDKRGEKQLRCHNCGKWIWEAFFLPFNYPTKNRFVCVTPGRKATLPEQPRCPACGAYVVSGCFNCEKSPTA